MSEFEKKYAAGSLKSVSQVAGVPAAGITQSFGPAPTAEPPAPAAAAASSPAETQQPAQAPVQQQLQPKQPPLATAGPGNKTATAAAGANTTATSRPKLDTLPAETAGGAAAAAASAAAAVAAQNLGSPTGGATAATAAPGGQPATQSNATAATAGPTPVRKLLLSARQQQHTRAVSVSQQLLLAGATWHLRRLQGVGDNTYATYSISSATPAVTARTVGAAARDGSLYKTLERNGVPLRPSISLDGNMLQKGEPAAGNGSSSGGSSGLGPGAIAGIVIGSIVGVALLAALGLLCCICCGKQKKAKQQVPADSTKAAAVAKAKADLAKANASNGGGGKKPLLSGSPNSSPIKPQASAPKTPSPVPVRRPKNLMDRFASWGAPQEANLGPGTGTGTSPPAAAGGKSGTAAAAAAAAAATAAAAAAAAAKKKTRSSSPGVDSMRVGSLRDQYQVRGETALPLPSRCSSASLPACMFGGHAHPASTSCTPAVAPDCLDKGSVCRQRYRQPPAHSTACTAPSFLSHSNSNSVRTLNSLFQITGAAQLV